MTDSGIYEIRNIENNKRYVGSATNVHKRFIDHVRALNERKHHNIHLQRVWNKHGSEIFAFKILLYCNKKNLIFYEQRAINTYKGSIYNISPVAGSQLGFKHSEETKRKWSVNRKGAIPWNKGAKGLQVAWNKDSNGNYSHAPHSEETKAKLSAALMGHLVSDATKEKISESSKGRRHPYKGLTGVFKHSKETKRKMSETRKSIPLWNRGRKLAPMPQEIRDKISKTSKGRKRSKEATQQMVETKRLKREGHYGQSNCLQG